MGTLRTPAHDFLAVASPGIKRGRSRRCWHLAIARHVTTGNASPHSSSSSPGEALLLSLQVLPLQLLAFCHIVRTLGTATAAASDGAASFAE